MFDLEANWTGTGSQDAFADFRTNLSGNFMDADGLEYRVFRNAGNHLHPATIWKVCAGIQEGNSYSRRPLFSGRLEARARNTPSSSGQPQWDFTARLAINPTRWITQQPLGLIRRPEAEWASAPVNLFHRDQPYTQEIGLVRGDNVHLGLPRNLSMCRPSMWMVQVERYIRSVRDLITQTLQRVADEGNGFAIQAREPSYTLKEIETYWEYWSPRPLERMRRLADPVRQLAASSSTAWHPLTEEAAAALSAAGAIEVGTDDNSPRILMRSGRGCTVRIYAKTDSRLRFEVAYDCNEARDTFAPLAGLPLEQLMARLALARERGAEQLSQVLDFIRPHVTVPEQERQIHELFAEIFRCASTPAAASVIVSMLVNNGRVATGPGFSVGLADMRRLMRRGVLTRGGMQGQDFTWVVTPQFEAALARLRDGS
ncbi:hypothetical protein LZK73_15220 [Neorhizobium galegae]|nr:hypothetical protein LZK73_15220 [Neorhizobium galegae]